MMRLLTMREVFGPTANAPDFCKRLPEVRDRGFVTEMSLGDAIVRINQYERAFNARYEKVDFIGFELIAVSTIEDIDDDTIHLAGLVHVEKLDDSLEAMNRRIDG